MKTIKINLYRFEELRPTAKNQAIKDYENRGETWQACTTHYPLLGMTIKENNLYFTEQGDAVHYLN